MSFVVRTLADLGPSITLAPERHRAAGLDEASGVPLGMRVIERTERVTGDALRDAIVIDTTHARDGVLDIAAARRAPAPPSSAKKRVHPGDLLVSRLRPYLRQIALAHPAALRACEGRAVACSTEFYVLAPRTKGESLAYLLPWLLGAPAQAVLAAAQEGGHHPRVPRELLLAMRIPGATDASRKARAREVTRALAALYAASHAYLHALR
jgi:hypothetical protein